MWPNPDSNGNCDSNANAHRDAHSYTDRDSNCHTNSNSDCDANSNSDPDPDSNTDGCHTNHYAERRHVYQSRDCAAFVRYVRRDDLLHHERRNPDH